MIDQSPVWTIIAGPNGAGKTTAAYGLLPTAFNTSLFLNTDEIAKGLSPFDPAAAAITAGKTMLKRMDELIAQKQSFVSETTLSSQTLAKKIKTAKANGYIIQLIYLWVPNIELAIERVETRALKGGHNVPEVDIRRRYQRGLHYLFKLFMPLCNQTIIYMNNGNFQQIALLSSDGTTTIFQPDEWAKIQSVIGS